MAGTIDWSLYSERAVGRNSPSFADVVNRPLREVLTISGADPDASFVGFSLVGHTHDASAIVSGTLPTTRGGTGLSSPTAGGLLVAAGALAMTLLAPGAASQVVKSNGAGWASAAIVSADISDAASINTASVVVKRDGSGNFAAGTITANLTGNASTATALATGRTITITGDLAYTSPLFDGSGNVTAAGTLATVNANVGTFGGSTAIPVFTVNAKGLITAASTAVVIAPAGTLTGATLASNVLASSLTSVGVLASPHLTSAVIDSGGLTITAGTLAAQALTATTGNFSSTLSATVLTLSADLRLGGSTNLFSALVPASGSLTALELADHSDFADFKARALTLTSTLAVTGGARIDGNIAYLTAARSDIGFYMGSTVTLSGNANQYGFDIEPVFGSAATSQGTVGYFKVRTVAAAFTMGTGIGLQIDSPTIGAASAITTLYGLRIENQSGAGTNYAIFTNGGQHSFGGNLIWGTDNSFDIGASGASRARDLFLARNATIGGALTLPTAAFGVLFGSSQVLYGDSSTSIVQGPTTVRHRIAGTDYLTTATTGVTLGTNTVSGYALVLNGAAASNRGVQLMTAGALRWFMYADTTAESGSNAGSLLQLSAYSDTGVNIDTPLTIQRAAGGTMTLSRPVDMAFTVGVNRAHTAIDALIVGGNVTTAGGVARGLYVNTTVNSSANADTLTSGRFDPNFANAGAFTGLTTRGLFVGSYTVPTGTTTASLIQLGALTGTGATTATGLIIGSVSGATNNYAIQTGAGGVFLQDVISAGPNGPNPAYNLWLNKSITAVAGAAIAQYAGSTLTASANNDVLRGQFVAPVYTPGAFTGVTLIGVDVNAVSGGASNFAIRTATGVVQLGDRIQAGTDNSFDIGQAGSNRFRDFFLARNATIGGSVTINSALSVGSGSGGATASINGGSGQFRTFVFQSAGANRWAFQVDATAESGANAGSNFALQVYADNGTLLDTPLSISRAAGSPFAFNRSLLAATDNAFDIGASGSNRFRDLFLARNFIGGGTISATGATGGITLRPGVTNNGCALDSPQVNLANLATLVISPNTNICTVTISANATGDLAIVALKGGANTVSVLASTGTWGTALGAANNYNVYYDAGSTSYNIENRSGGICGFTFTRMGNVPNI